MIINKLFNVFKSDILKNTLILFSLNIFQRLFGVVNIYFLVRVLSQEEFGNYRFILSCLSFVSFLALPNLNNSIMQSSARKFYGTYIYSIKPMLKFCSLGSLLLAVVSIWFFNKDKNLFYAFILTSAMFPFMYGLQLWNGFKSGKQQFIDIALVQLVCSALISLFIFLSYIGHLSDNWVIILCYVVIIPSFFNIIMTIITIKDIDCKANEEKDSVKYGIKTSFYASFNIISLYIDKILVYLFVSPEMLAIYVVAERIPDVLKSLCQSFTSVLGPIFAVKEKYTRNLDKKINTIFFIGFTLILIFSEFVYPYINDFLFGVDYSGSTIYGKFLLFSLSFTLYSILKSRYITSHLHGENYKIVFLYAALLKIATSVLFIPFFGVEGAIASIIISRVFSVCVVHYIIRTRYLN